MPEAYYQMKCYVLQKRCDHAMSKVVSFYSNVLQKVKRIIMHTAKAGRMSKVQKYQAIHPQSIYMHCKHPWVKNSNHYADQGIFNSTKACSIVVFPFHPL